MDSNFQYAGAVNLVVALPVVHVPRRARSALARSSSRKLLPLALEAARNETVLGIDSAIAAFVDHAFLSHEFAAHAGGVRYSHEERSPGSPITRR